MTLHGDISDCQPYYFSYAFWYIYTGMAWRFWADIFWIL